VKIFLHSALENGYLVVYISNSIVLSRDELGANRSDVVIPEGCRSSIWYS
jgi:hypothetical protein